MPNWIAWNGPALSLKLYFRQTELFEIELFNI